MKLLSTYKEFILEKNNSNIDSNLILEGGAAGHMMHPFDDRNLTFDDFRKFIDAGLQGEMTFDEEPTEKTDGQNVFATVKDGKVLFARNKGQLKSPLTLNGITDMFKNHASELVRDTFTFAAQDLANSLSKLSKEDQEKYFDNGNNFMNMELIYSKNPNVINYDRDVIQFHGIKITDGEGNITGEMGSSSAKEISNLLDRVEAKVGKVFTIIPPQVLKLRKDVSFDDNTKYFMKKVDALQNKYNLNGADEVSRYIRPFEDLFLELGSVVLKNAANFVAASPDAEMQRLHDQIRTEAGKIKRGDNLTQIAKVEAELARLDRIGGIESIIPTEGLVFKYKGKIYKLTGTFAAINQLMGIIKYGR